MTCIVGIVDSVGDSIKMGSDSQRTMGSYIRSDKDPKIWKEERYGKTWLLGLSGKSCDFTTIRCKLEWPEKMDGEDNFEFIVKKLIPPIRAMLRDDKSLKIKEGVETMENELLIGVQGQFYSVEGSFSVGRISDPYCAIGSGTPYALGSLGTSAGEDWSPRKRMKKALTLADKHCTDVSAPFHYLST